MILDSSVTNFFAIKRFSTIEDEYNIKYGDKFSFEKSVYFDHITPIEITCKKHNKSFYQSPSELLRRQSGCEDCKKENRVEKAKQDFLSSMSKKYPEYDLSKVIYVDSKTKVDIICPKHGIFSKSPTKLISRNGCPECIKEEMYGIYHLPKEEYFKRLTDNYGLDNAKRVDLTEYESLSSNIKVTLSNGKIVSKVAKNLLPTHGKIRKLFDEVQHKCSLYTSEEIIEKVFSKYGSKIIPIVETFKGVKHKMDFICCKHGKFSTTLDNMNTNTHGCHKCGTEMTGKKKSIPFNTFVERAKLKHKDRFTYIEDTYVNYGVPACVVCPTHGTFEIMPEQHIKQKYGCPECAKENTVNLFVPYFEKPTTLYYIKVNKDNKEFYKIGITTTEVQKRFRTIHLDNATYEVISTKLFDTGLLAYNIEQEILRSNKDIKINYVLLEKTGGNSEILTEDIYPTIKHYFEQD